MKNIEVDNPVEKIKIITKQELTNIFENFINNNETFNFNEFIESRIKNKKVAIYGGGK